jgi:MoaA/NifB/PqqE/SkfB family radical SAM enzyme
VEHAVETGLKTNLTTNGTLINKDTARRLVKAGVNSISISLDAPKAPLHDQLRGTPGAFKATVQAIRWLRRFSQSARRRIKVRINFVVMENNYRKLPEMVRLAAELGAVDLCAMPVDEKGNRKRRLSGHQIETYNREIAPQVLELRGTLGFTTDSDSVYPFGVTPREIKYGKKGLYARGLYESKTCLAPWLHTYVSWSGEVFLCCMTNGRMEPLGNLAQMEVREVFHGSAYHRIRTTFRQGRHLQACHRCDLFLKENRQLHSALAGLAQPVVF